MPKSFHSANSMSSVSVSEIKGHLAEEEQKLTQYPVGSRQYDKALRKIALLEVMLENKRGK